MRFTYIKLLSVLALAVPAFSEGIQRSDLLGSYEIKELASNETIDDNGFYHEAFVYESSITMDDWKYSEPILWHVGTMRGTWDFADSKFTMLFLSLKDKRPQSQYRISISLKNVTLDGLRSGVEVESVSQIDEQPVNTSKVWIKKTDKRDYRLWPKPSSQK